MRDGSAGLVGAEPAEVVIMNTLSVNIHMGLVSASGSQTLSDDSMKCGISIWTYHYKTIYNTATALSLSESHERKNVEGGVISVVQQ